MMWDKAVERATCRNLAATDKYMPLKLNAAIVDDKIRARCTASEVLDHKDQAQHPLVREALWHFSKASGIEIVSIADIASVQQTEDELRSTRRRGYERCCASRRNWESAKSTDESHE
jgi:hypothetical protein